MTGIVHSFVSTNTNGSDASLVQKNAWNHDHATSDWPANGSF